MELYTSEDWYNLANDLHRIILSEMNNVSDDNLPEVYPKLVVMYEFFRLVRGEAFHSVRPAGIGESQEKIYKMENDLLDRLKILENKLDANDDKAKYYLELMKKSFNLKD